MEQNSYLITMKPKNDQLKKLIAYYYFHVSDNEKHSESFYFYPNYMHALTVYKGSDVIITKEKSIISQIKPSSDSNKFTFLYTVNLKEKIQVNIQGAFYKIGIVFYPLGINHFIEQSLSEIMDYFFQEINLDKKFKTCLSPLSKELLIKEQLEIVENALLAILTPFEEKKLQKAIKEIVLSNGAIKVDELEKHTEVSRKTLLRLFKKHTLSTIEEYKKMVMFRNSLNYALQHKELVNLTDIALYNMYYDQSHFIKHFKSITNEIPKTLLPKIKQIGNEDLYWHFIEE